MLILKLRGNLYVGTFPAGEGKDITWSLLAGMHKNLVKILEDFFDLKRRKNEVEDPALVQQLNNTIKTQALSIILFFLSQVCHLMVTKWLPPHVKHHVFT